MTKKKLRVFEAFAGYGGASFGLERAGIAKKVVGYSEVNPDAISMYSLNFPKVKNYGDITKIKSEELPDFDLFTGGFPCQPFSPIGKCLGVDDEQGRGTLFHDIIRICEAKQPRFILLENVSRLCRGKFLPTFEIIIEELHRIGYDVRYAILNSNNYGVPQSRERLWIFGYLGTLPEDFELNPEIVAPCPSLSDYLDSNPDPELYRSPAQVARLKEVHHVQSFIVDRPTCFDVYNHKFRTDDCCMTVTPPNHNVVRIVEPPINGVERVRKLSIDEHFRLMGFVINKEKREIIYPENLTYRQLGERAGNGWEINIVSVIFKHIFKHIKP